MRLILLFLLLAFAPPAVAQEPAGVVAQQKGQATRLAGGAVQSLGVGMSVFPGDQLTTGEDARLAVTFADGSELTLGGGARITIDAFVFGGADRRQSLNVVTGAFRFTTGVIGRVAPDQLAIRTPVAVIGVRGTRFAGGPLAAGAEPGQRRYGFQLNEGAITVQSAGGSVVLDQPGEGTFLPFIDPASPQTFSAAELTPTPPRRWSAAASDELNAALAF